MATSVFPSTAIVQHSTEAPTSRLAIQHPDMIPHTLRVLSWEELLFEQVVGVTAILLMGLPMFNFSILSSAKDGQTVYEKPGLLVLFKFHFTNQTKKVVYSLYPDRFSFVLNKKGVQ